jgi:hypothetical protein
MVTSLSLVLLGGTIQSGGLSGETQRRIEELRQEALQRAPAPITLPPATGLPGTTGQDAPIQLPDAPPPGQEGGGMGTDEALPPAGEALPPPEGTSGDEGS